MPTSYTSLIGLALPVTGELAGQWGTTVNDYITQYVDSAVAGTQTISGSQTAVTLSVTNGSSLVTAGSGATGSAQFQIINCTGNPAGLLTITAPASSRQYIIINATSTSQSVKIVGVGPTTGVTILSGEKAHVAWNGSDFVKIATQNGNGDFVTVDTTNLEVTNIKAKDGTAAASIADSTGVVSITANPILSGGTANGVAYLNGSKVVTTGSALTFDGTNLGIGAASGGQRLFMYKAGAAVTVAFQSDANTNGQSIDFLNNAAGISGQIYYLPSSGYMSFSTAGSEQMRLNNTGLGIGTSSPGYAKLSVWGGVGIKDNEYLWWNTASTDVPLDYIVGSRASHYLKFGTNGSDRLTLDSSGNLGLGVTPSAWYAVNTKAFQIGASSSVNDYSASGNRQTTLANNAYLNASAAWTYSNTDPASRYHQTGGQHQWYTAASGTAGTAITFTQAMTLDANGNLMVGTTTANGKLAVYQPTSGDGTITVGNSQDIYTCNVGKQGSSAYGATSAGDAFLYTSTKNISIMADGASSVIKFSAGGNTERARITSGGYFKASNDGTYIGSTGGYHELRSNLDNNNAAIVSSNAANGTQYGLSIRTTNDQNDATRNFLECLGGATLRAAIYSNGGLSNYSANNVNLASDERLKKDISPLATTWGKLKQIEVVNFRYKDCNEGDPLLYGVIAQQVQSIVPELVVVTRKAQEAVEAKTAVLDEKGEIVEPAVEAKEATPEYYGIREQPMYWLAIKALQEAMARIEALEAKVTALESKGA